MANLLFYISTPGPPAPLTWSAGSPINIYEGEAKIPVFAPLDTGGFACAYQKSQFTTEPCFIKTYNASGVEVVAEQQFTATIDQGPGIAKLSNGNIVLAWKEPGDSNKGKYMILNSSLGTVKAVTTFESGTCATRTPPVIPLSGGGFLICYSTTDDSFQTVVYNDAGTEQSRPSAVSMDFYSSYFRGVANGTGALISYIDSSVYDVGYMVINSSGVVTYTKTSLTGDCCDLPYGAIFGNGNIGVFFYDNCDSDQLAYIIHDSDNNEIVSKTILNGDVSRTCHGCVTLESGRVMILTEGTPDWAFSVIGDDGTKHQTTVSIANVNSISYNGAIEAALLTGGDTVVMACSDHSGDQGKFALITGV